MNQLFKSSTHGTCASSRMIKENVAKIDKLAKEELDGIDLDVEDTPEEINVDVDTGDQKTADDQGDQEYNLKHVVSQLNGMVDHWFHLAQGMDDAKRDNFMKLGDRMSEIVEVIESEFLNA